MDARINGIDVVALLDTGCTSTVMGVETAKRLGVAREDRALGEVDLLGFGESSRARRYWASLELGSWRVEQTPVNVVDNDTGILIGSAFLSQFDLYIAADEGLVGFFPPQQAPLPSRAVAVPMPTDGFGTPTVLVGTPGRSPAWFTFDTGAGASAVPAPWARGRPVVGEHWSTTVHGRRRNERFAFDLYLGTQGLNVGASHASANGNSLGLDVVRRFHAVLSPFLGQRSRPPPWRTSARVVKRARAMAPRHRAFRCPHGGVDRRTAAALRHPWPSSPARAGRPGSGREPRRRQCGVGWRVGNGVHPRRARLAHHLPHVQRSRSAVVCVFAVCARFPATTALHACRAARSCHSPKA